MPTKMPGAAISFPILGDIPPITVKEYIEIGNLRIYWYAIIIATGFLLAVWYGCRHAKEFGLKEDHLFDLVIFGVPAAIICARIYYVVFYWSEYKDDLSAIFKIWNGGLGMYGVIIGAVITAVVYCKVKKIKISAVLDIVAIGFVLAQAVGRWGNFINREAFGYETTLPWRMGLTLNGETIYVHPTFLYESLWNFLGFLVLHFIVKKHRKYDGEVCAAYVAWYGFGRMLIEGLRTDSLMLFNTGIRVSQLVAFVTFCLATAFLIYNRRREHSPEKLFVNVAPAGGEEAPEENTDDVPSEEDADIIDESASDDVE